MQAKIDAIEFWTLVGLANLAGSLTEQLTTVSLAMVKITGEELDDHYDLGHAGDLVYSLDMNAVHGVRKMLSNLSIDHDEQLPQEAGDDLPDTP